MADAHHAEWLSLLDISGPFLSPPVLDRVFPQGLDAADPDHTAKLRLGYEEWAEEQQKADPDPAIHDAWIRFVLTETLGITPEVLLEGDGVPEELEFSSPEHGETIRPDFVVFDPEDEPGTRKPRLLISVWPADTELDQPVDDARWTASPIDRMIALCRSEQVGLRLGLVTNGERWTLVDAPVGETSAHASWYANLWGPEPLTLRAFRSLLGLRRFFGVAENDRLDAMLVESANYQTEVTDQLGFQVRRAVEVLVQAIDRADADTGRILLADTDPARIYEAALTVMMRLVFLFSAEERGLLRLGDSMYDQFYAVSTLHAQLQEAADLVGPEVLERRQDAWSRLLGTFRAIYGGVHHQDLQIIPYGSSLFDPDRFPFLEGRTDDTTWKDTDALPLPIDNRTVLLLLRSLQMLDLGKGKGARKLSFRALDIEQIGHVYETLLDHSAYRATEPMVSLQGNHGREPEIPVSRLMDLMLQEGDEPLVDFLKSELKKGVNPIRKALEKGRTPEPEAIARLRRACGGDDILLGRLLPFHDLIRLDPWGDPVVIPEGAVFVTAGEDRRSTGTHYTPRALTEEIVQYALVPVVYRGPAEGKDREEWQLKSPDEILELKVCDPAMGSGAFLVQACRYLSERLVESWETVDRTSDEAGGDLMPQDAEERLSLARRLVADRCLYGVDVNPLAVEMAKLSLWLVTLARETPFTFLDHALKCGDSLLGVRDLRQLRHFHIDPARGPEIHQTLFNPTAVVESATSEAAELRRQLESLVVEDIYDAHQKDGLNRQADAAVDNLRLLASVITAGAVSATTLRDDSLLLSAAPLAVEWLERGASSARGELAAMITGLLGMHDPDSRSERRPFHWVVEYPEVFARRTAGFDAIVMNPPFLGGSKISGALGPGYREWLTNHVGSGRRGNADLSAFFLLRASQLVNNGGCVASLATNSIGQGDTRAVGLDRIVESGFDLYAAEPSRPWPGSAAVAVSILGLYRGKWSGRAELSGEEVRGISPALTPRGRIDYTPVPLSENSAKYFYGTYVHGTGFILDPEEALELIRKDSRNAEALSLYLNGDDLNSRPDQSPSRWVINFRDWSLTHASKYPDLLSIVEQRVKPKRLGHVDRRLAEFWWQFKRPTPALYDAIAEKSEVLVAAQTSKYLSMSLVPATYVYSHATVVFNLDDPIYLGLLNTSWHTEWIIRYCSMLETRLRYFPSDGFETFPLPKSFPKELAEASAQFRDTRAHVMELLRSGLTAFYNRVHDPADRADEVVAFRDRMEVLDNAAALAYGWGDLALDHAFRETSQGVRFTLGQNTMAEVVDRLLELNQRRTQQASTSRDAGPHTSKEPGPQLEAGTLFAEDSR